MHSNPRVDEILTHLEDVHLRLLRVCHDFPKDGYDTFCGEWIRNQCEQQGIAFHQSWLRKLANLNLLERLNSSRGGSRRYYRMKDADLVREVLALQPA